MRSITNASCQGNGAFMLASGIVDLALAAIIYAAFPVPPPGRSSHGRHQHAFRGVALIGLALHARHAAA